MFFEASRRRRCSPVIVLVYFVFVVADFIRHHSAAAAASDADVVKAELGNDDVDSDERDLIVAAKRESFGAFAL